MKQFLLTILKEKLEKHNTKLKQLIEDHFSRFADTSSDCNDFGRIISEDTFNKMLTYYFCSIKDGLVFMPK